MLCFTTFTLVPLRITPVEYVKSFYHEISSVTPSQGMDDLREGLIRTPLNPKETFRDDPLRLLRVVRFASRYGFTIASEIMEAAKSVAEEV
jgi:hypothetical protein